VAKIEKNGPKMEFFDFFEKSQFLNVFHDLKNVKIAENLMFLILHALGHPKSVTFFVRALLG
jgi:hypothetical protein